MKLLILLFTAWLASRDACAQQIRLSLKNASFSQLLQSIEQQTDYSFIYSKDQLQLLPTVNLTATRKDLFEILNEQLKNQPVTYTVDNHFIIFYTRQHAVADSLQTVRGRVINAAGKALAGVTVQVRNEAAVTITDEQGHFFLQYLSQNALLQISGAEFAPTLISINRKNYIEVRMNERIKELDETIIMAYGKTTRRFNTGNISKVSAAELENQSAGNLLSALQGRVPGLLITASSGAPGASFIAQIRGQNSVNPNPLINNGIAPVDNPLIIVNGVPFAPQNNNINQLESLASPGKLEIYHNPYGGISPLTSIDPSDIESIEISKDADMTAIYGSRAANGIIFITTRQPKAGKTTLLMDVSSGINIATSRPSMMNTSEYLDLRKKAFAMDSIQPGLGRGEINYAPDLLIFDSTKNTDWQKYFFRNATPFINAHTRVTGGDEQLHFISGISYRQESNLVKGDFFNKSLALNNSVTYCSPGGRLELAGSMYYSRGENRSIQSALLLQAINLAPNYPDLLDENGQVKWEYNGIELTDNPAAWLHQPYIIKTHNLVSSLNIKYQILRGFYLRLNAGLNNFVANETSLFAASAVHPFERKNSFALFAENWFQTILAEPQLEYRKYFSKTTITLLSGATIQKNTLSLANSKGSGYQTDELLGSPDAAGAIDSRMAVDKYHYQSIFGRITVLHKEKYLLNLTGRRERSNRFSTGREWGNFASVAGGWIFSEEKFSRNLLPVISFGKLRFSYGSSGNDNAGYNHQLNAWSSATTYAGTSPLIPSALSDADFSWSITKKMEVALQLRLLKDKLSIDISRYRHECSNQLISQLSFSQPAVSRYISNYPAVVQNKGWEIELSAAPVRLKKFQWNTSVNITFPKNMLKSFPGIENILYSDRYFPGQSLSVVKLKRFTGVDKETGLYSFDPDKYAFKDKDPLLFGGFRNTVSYKQFKLEVFVEFRKQEGVNYSQQISNNVPGMINQPSALHEHWQYSGDSRPLQRLTTVQASPAHIAALMLSQSDATYSDASYIRLKILSITYSPAKSKIKMAGLSNISVYLRMQNLFTMTSFKWTDPELQSFYSYPLQRSFSAGITIQL